jgi:hypothetical protein
METGKTGKPAYKTVKYFKYAVGEIVLVVIGILIAVGINSRYNAAQNETKIKAVLTQVQQDLVTDMLDAKRIYNIYIEKDSLFLKIMNDSITYEIYKKNPYPLPITDNYVSFSNKKGGYNRFMDNLENLPEKYNCLLPYFNNLYVEMQNDIDDYNTYIKNTVMIDGRAHLKTNPKAAEYFVNSNSDEALEYYFKDPFLKNKSAKYMNDLNNISFAANNYRIESLEVYKKIDSLLEKAPTTLPEPLSIQPNKDLVNAFVGDYTGKSIIFGDTLSLSMKKENLVLKASNTENIKLYWQGGDYYFIKEFSDIIKLYKNKRGQHIIEISSIGTHTKFTNTKDL